MRRLLEIMVWMGLFKGAADRAVDSIEVLLLASVVGGLTFVAWGAWILARPVKR